MDKDKLARKIALEVATVLGVTLHERASYSYAATTAAVAWRIEGNRHGARLAVNVEDEDNPIPIIETGPLANPVHHMTLCRFGATWVEASPYGGPQLVNALGTAHPVLH